MMIKKILCVGGMLFVSSHESVASDCIDSEQSQITAQVSHKQNPCLNNGSGYAGTTKDSSKEYPYIRSVKNFQRKTNQADPVFSGKKKLQAGQKIIPVFPHRSICHKQSQKVISFAPVSDKSLKNDLTRKPQETLRVSHARKFNRSYLRQKYLAD